MYINTYNHLPKEAQKIRETVFMKEQGFHNEFDEIDSYANHLVLFDENIPIATCRFFRRESCEDYFIGRIAVIKEYRGKNIGAFLLKAAETQIKNIGGKRIFLHAQCRAKEFYEKQGYKSYGEVVLEESCPHIWMCK
ncbi:MAG: GNAT family N-acetyltransferase [Lachnospiraceae bacterium]|nr:GNAT family N-acetyltransferase [Lachnospiraceae bacterium]